MKATEARLVVVGPPELDAGFRLTGVDTVTAETALEADSAIRWLLGEGERGVIAVHAPFFRTLPEDLRKRLEGSISPVVVELPTGLAVESDEVRRTRLAERLQMAIGYHVSFGEEAP